MVVKIGAPAPDFKALSTKGTISLSKYKGKWVVLFTHPADFTPVCASEIIEFARRIKEFEDLNTQLVGASIDSIYSHLAWIKELESQSGVKITYPIIADVNKEVARLYDVIDEKLGLMYRGVFIIDPNGLVRYAIYHPIEIGRSVQEILRVLRALQTFERERVLCPVEWRPGQPTIPITPLPTE